MHSLVRQSRKEKQDNKPPKSYRQLYQLIKEQIPEPGKPRIWQKDEEKDDE
ncbi:hypothetical protein [Chromobacterium sphagni]|uniref:hypothetical protein n=1 Tax=Chromobacterium sphagni TaxID=1903179 RepID=UPI003B983A69